MNTLEAIEYIESQENPCHDTYLDSFQHLIDTGIVWTLEGWYGRTALYFIEKGLLKSALKLT